MDWLLSFILYFSYSVQSRSTSTWFGPWSGRLLLGEQVQATNQSVISMSGQGHAKRHFLLLSFLLQELISFPHNPSMEAAKNKVLCSQAQMSFSASLFFFLIYTMCLHTCICVSMCMCVHVCGMSSLGARTPLFIALPPAASTCLAFNNMLSGKQWTKELHLDVSLNDPLRVHCGCTM